MDLLDQLGNHIQRLLDIATNKDVIRTQALEDDPELRIVRRGGSESHSPHKLFENMYTISLASNALIEEIEIVQQKEGFSDMIFFRIRSFRTGNQEVSNEVLWVLLEEKMYRTFTIIEGNGVRYKSLK